LKFSKLPDGDLCIYAGKICRKKIIESKRLSYAEPLEFYPSPQVFSVESNCDTVRVIREDFIKHAVIPYVKKKLAGT
jgi:hypothetical protein